MRTRYYGINRYLCSVLDDMRKCDETKNYAPLKSLIEEAQILGNRMEAGLADVKDIKNLLEERSELKKEVKELREEAGKLKKKLGKKDDKKDTDFD